MHDSGKREQFESGAVRDTAEGKSRPDLVSPYAEERIGNWMAKGAEKYDERNWEKGMSISRCVASISRHLIAFKMGLQDEDHLAAIAVNAQFIMHYQAMIGRGKLPATLDDMPDYEDIVRRGELEELLAEDDRPHEFEPGDVVFIILREDTGYFGLKDAVEENNHVGTIIAEANDTPPNLHLHVVKIGTKEYKLYPDEMTLLERKS